MKTRLFIFIVLILFIASILNAEEVRGCTHKEILPKKFTVIGQAEVYNPVIREKTKKDANEISCREDWELIETYDIDSFLRRGKYLGVEFNSIEQNIEIITNFEELIPEAVEAIDRSPAWMRADLRNVFRQLSDSNQAAWAEIINTMSDLYIDEIAFSIANSSVAYLSSGYSNPNMFVDNAILMYIADSNLDYVEIVDYGSSTTDENYYSTTLYWKINESGDMVQVEVPKEIYYMYLVHPKITDEIAAYIDPDIIENNYSHTNNIADPPVGYFWRNFLYNFSDTGYPLLKDMLALCPVVWDASLTTSDDAILTMTAWINESMSFTSNNERPHQPVRIYRKHIGRCGEHADLTAAVCRSALIPCTSILAISKDHTWN